MDVADKIKFVQSTLEPMAWHTYPHIAGVVAIEDAENGRHVGSGLRFAYEGRRCLVTAAHVIDEAMREGRIAVSAVRGQPPHELGGVPARIDRTLDVAVYFLPDGYPEEGISFWPAERTDPSGDKLSTDYLFVHGFPGVRARFSALLGGLVKQSFPGSLPIGSILTVCRAVRCGGWARAAGRWTNGSRSSACSSDLSPNGARTRSCFWRPWPARCEAGRRHGVWERDTPPVVVLAPAVHRERSLPGQAALEHPAHARIAPGA